MQNYENKIKCAKHVLVMHGKTYLLISMVDNLINLT